MLTMLDCRLFKAWICAFVFLVFGADAEKDAMKCSPEVKLGVSAINNLVFSEMKKRNIDGVCSLKEITFKYTYTNDVSQAFLRFKDNEIVHVGYFPAGFLPGYKDSFPTKIDASGCTYKSIEGMLRSVLISESKDFEKVQLILIKWNIFAENYSSTGTLRLNPDDEVTYFNPGLGRKGVGPGI